jgi:hypothetical protein
MILEATQTRVSAHTDEESNRRIRDHTEANVTFYGRAGVETIDRRLEELAHEWDIERVLEANAATAVLAGVVLTATVDRRFLVVPAAVAAFLLQHAVQGWCPPLGLFRRLGVRTADEIGHERYALKALRGDFAQVKPPTPEDGSRLSEAVHAARR